jgi:hypothetical protein
MEPDTSQPTQPSTNDGTVTPPSRQQSNMPEPAIFQPTVISPTTFGSPETQEVSSQQAATVPNPAFAAPDSTVEHMVPGLSESSPVATTLTDTAEPAVAEPVVQPMAEQTSPVAPDTIPFVGVPMPEAPYTPVVPGAIMSGGDGMPVGSSSTKKKLLLLGGGVVVIVALLVGAVFGLYLPNTPDNVFSTGITRTGKALDMVVTSATEPKKLASYKTSAISGSVDATLAGSKYTGKFTTIFDKSSLDGGLDFTLNSSDGTKEALNAKVLSQIPADSNYPDVYFQVNGIKSLGLDALIPGISEYDGKWIVASSEYLKSVGGTFLSTTDNTQTQVTSSDIAELARTSSAVTKDYLFSTTQDKAVFIRQSFVGKENIDGLTAYHYKVGVNVAHAKAYCVALTNSLLATSAYKKLSGETTAQLQTDKKTTVSDCQTSVDQTVKSSDSFDMWIDGKYKLVHKFRIYDTQNKGSYTDVGQLYKGGDKLSVFANYHDETGKSDGTFTLDTDLQTSSTKGVITFKSSDSNNPYDITATIEAVSSTKPVTITKPTNPLKIQDVLSKFGIDTSPGAVTSISAKADDSKRKTDINALQAFSEAEFSSSGYYPTLAEINSTSWRATHMKGLDPAALTPPSSTVTTLAATSSLTQYAYVPAGCTAIGCATYTLSALLSNGSTFSRSSL